MPGRLELATQQPTGLLIDPYDRIDDLLCCALRGESAPWSRLGADDDADAFAERCSRQGVAGLVYHAMHGRPEWNDWPQPVRRALEQSNKAIVAKDLLRGHYLMQLLDYFAQRDIPCLLLKGEALAHSHYATPGTRPRSDCDMFIPLDRIEDVRSILEGAGFRIATPIYKSHQFTAIRPHDPALLVRFDIHWRLSNHPRYARLLSFHDMLGRSVVVPGLVAARAPALPDALLLACLHRVANERHDRNRLIWLYDIHQLASSLSGREQDEFRSLAQEKEVLEECIDGLLSARGRFGTDLSRIVMSPEEATPRIVEVPQPSIKEWSLLLLDDWRNLPDRTARSALLREYLFPPREFLETRDAEENSRSNLSLYLSYWYRGLRRRF